MADAKSKQASWLSGGERIENGYCLSSIGLQRPALKNNENIMRGDGFVKNLVR